MHEMVRSQNVIISEPYGKAEFTEEGTFFANRFPSLRTFVNKKFEKQRSPPSIQLLKLSLYHTFHNKNCDERNFGQNRQVCSKWRMSWQPKLAQCAYWEDCHFFLA